MSTVTEICVQPCSVARLPYSLEDRAGTEDRQLAGVGRTGEIRESEAGQHQSREILEIKTITQLLPITRLLSDPPPPEQESKIPLVPGEPK